MCRISSQVLPLNPTLNVADLAHLIVSITKCSSHFHPASEATWPLKQFICSVMTASRCKVSAILVAFIYLHRASARLKPGSFGRTSTQERIFVAALVLATKVRSSHAPNPQD